MTRFLRLPQVVARVGLSPMTLWRRERQKPPTFPLRVPLGPNSVAWEEDAIEQWCRDRLAERDARAGRQATKPATAEQKQGERR
jgi:predicted DNA-binding transcriptional regulator AlpA